MATYVAKPGEVEKKWILIDADGLVVGRLAALIATRLKGKHKAIYTPHVDCGDNIVVINAEKVIFSGDKHTDKIYYKHTGWRGGIKHKTAGEMLRTEPEEVIRLAVWGMLPKGPLGRRIIKKLKVYPGPQHDHSAQKPRVLQAD